MTMTGTKTAQELLLEARGISGGTKSYVLHLARGEGGISEEMGNSERNTALSDNGKLERNARVRKYASHLLITEMANRREAFDKLLDEAEVKTKAQLVEEHEDLNETDRIMYNAELQSLKTKMLLAPNENTALQYLDRMVEISSANGNTAKELQAYFDTQLAKMVSNSKNLTHIRTRLIGMSDRLARASQVENFDSVKRQLQDIEELRRVPWAMGATETFIQENFGYIAKDYVNKPYAYREEQAEMVQEIKDNIARVKRFGGDLYAQ